MVGHSCHSCDIGADNTDFDRVGVERACETDTNDSSISHGKVNSCGGSLNPAGVTAVVILLAENSATGSLRTCSVNTDLAAELVLKPDTMMTNATDGGSNVHVPGSEAIGIDSGATHGNFYELREGA